MGGFFQQLGVQAGYNMMYQDQKALTDADLEIKQQTIAQNKMTLMQEKANMDARAKVTADFLKDSGADKASIQGPESLAKGSLAKAQEYGRLGDTEDEAKEYTKYEMFTKQATDARADVQEKVQQSQEVTAKSAEDELAAPTPESAAETDKAAAAAGINMKDAPVFGDPRRETWLKQRIRGAMKAKDVLEFDQKEEDKRLTREQRQDEKAALDKRDLDKEKDTKQYREDKLSEDKRHDKEVEALRRAIIDNKKAGEVIPTQQTTADFENVAAKFGYTPAGFEAAVDAYNTDKTLPSVGRSNKNQPLIAAIQNRAAEKYPGENVAVNKLTAAASKTALAQTTAREAAVNRMTGSVKLILPRIEELSGKINTRLGGTWGNTVVNDAISKFGDNPELQELVTKAQTVSREYKIATTMPGSNAQMHTTHAEDAEKILNGNFPAGKLKGAIRGMLDDMEASDVTLKAEKVRITREMAGGDRHALPGDKAVTKPYADADKEARYQEWKKRHGND